ncbi:MAG: tRNA 2-thiouridine(34) synthase MnmA [Spirochaetia bacterium]|nr:tRNA 2-thiouridine(34) synthase MnmA [Spirochaetia bacterium]
MNDGIIAIGMSGGVDSSVAAHLLTQRWSRVVGVSHYIWEDSNCCNTETLQRAREICDRLGIPFYILNLVDEFQKFVVDDFVENYRHGKTPNPCVRCNEFVRFGLFPQRIKTLLVEQGHMSAEEPLHMATGHYVRTQKQNGRTLLQKGIDTAKDQSYMLYHINPDILPLCDFPLGGMTKPQVVELAHAHEFPSSSIKESQDVCFVDGKYIDFIEEYTKNEVTQNPGRIVDMQGRPLGEHRGYMHYTIGQRQGLGLSDGPWYVAKLNAAENKVVVARKEELGDTRFSIERCNWFIPVSEGFEATVRVRYNAGETPCRVTPGSPTLIELKEPHIITPGQSAVLYEGDNVLGGGIIR